MRSNEKGATYDRLQLDDSDESEEDLLIHIDAELEHGEGQYRRYICVLYIVYAFIHLHVHIILYHKDK